MNYPFRKEITKTFTHDKRCEVCKIQPCCFMIPSANGFQLICQECYDKGAK